MSTHTRTGQPTLYDSTQPATSEGAEKTWLEARSRGAQWSGRYTTSAAPRPREGSTSDSVPDTRVVEAARRALIGVRIHANSPQFPVYKVQGMEKWEGRILEVSDGIFSAELEPYDESGQIVSADFSLDLLAPETDVRAGDLIYVTARTVVDKPGFPPSRTVNVRLRRTGNWSREQVDAVWDRAAESKKRYDALFD